MCAKKAAETKSPAGSPKAASAIRRFRGPLLAVLILAAGGGVWYAVWQRVKPHVLAESDYQLDPKNIEVTPAPPKWIHADIKAEVIRDASLAKSLSILDPELTVHIKRSFQPASLDCRSPSGQQAASGRRGSRSQLPRAGGDGRSDARAAADRRRGRASTERGLFAQAGRSLSASGRDQIDSGRASRHALGRPAGKRRRQIAAVLIGEWQRLKLYRIVASAAPIGGKFSDDYSFDLFTHGGTRVVWGRVGDGTVKGEATSGQKAAKLLELAGPEGVLDDEVPGKVIDLAGPLQRTAIKPLPKRDNAD